MKTRYSFKNYILQMIRMNLITSIIAGIAITSAIVVPLFNDYESFASNLFWLLLLALIVTSILLGVINGLFGGFIASLTVSLIAYIFFEPSSIFDIIKQILLFIIIVIISPITLYTASSLIFGFDTLLLLHIFIGFTSTVGIISAHYFARQYLVTPIEKPKSKNSP